jgi:hypothetical protein
MKTKLSLAGICILLILTITYTTYSQGKKNDQGGKKEQQNKAGKDHGNPNKEDKGNGKKDNEDKRDKPDKTDKPGNSDKNDHKNGNNHKNDAAGVYHWNNKNFKERDKLKKQEKVTLCHKTGSNEPGVTLNVSRNALQAHLNHGDAMGDCPNVNDSRYTNGFLKRRNEYYNTLQQSQEQVLYSKSIYDYALERLTNSRSQLVIMQRNNAPAADIQQRQLVVTELEQNVSVLQTLIGVAVNLLASKL